jgi:hypothetical protein
LSVDLLFCEGGTQSYDIRILRKLLQSSCQVIAGGSSRGLRKRIDHARQFYETKSVFAIRDRDFPKKWTGASQFVLEWITPDHQGQMKHWGWIWPRREIENYLIDPIIVQKSLEVCVQQKIFDVHLFNFEDYMVVLNSARDSIAVYQAARIALTQAGKPRYLCTSFGHARGQYNYRFPQQPDRSSCEHEIKILFQNHDQSLVTLKETLTEFHRIIDMECSRGKPRYQDYLYAFSGKDLLWAMEDWFAKTPFRSHAVFQETILTGIENANEDIALWCHEWKDLVNKIKNDAPSINVKT